MSRRIAAALVLAAAAVALLPAPPARADCKSPLPATGLHELDERVDRDPVAALAEADRRLAALDPADALQAAALQAIRADAYSLMEDDVAVLAAVAAGRAQLQRLPDGPGRRALDIRLEIVAADSPQTAVDMAGAVERLARLDASLPVKSLDRACALVVRSRQLMRLGREETAAVHGIRGRQLAEAIQAPAAVADADYQLAYVYLRAGLLQEGLARAEAASRYDRSTGRRARLANDLYVRAKLLEQLQRHAEALAALEAANSINVQLRQDIAIAFNNLLRCRLLVSMQRLEAAAASCREASAVMTQSGRIDQRAIVEGELARIDLARGRPAAAVARLDRVIDADRDRVPPRVLPRLYKYRADALGQAGRYEAAWRDLQRVAQLTDALNPTGQSLGVAEIKERLNTEMVRREQARLTGELQHARQDALDHARIHRLYLALGIAAGLLLLVLALLAWLRARHERVRRAAARRLETQARVIATMREGVVLLDAQGRIRYANPSFQRLFGQSLEALTALPLERLGIDVSAAPVADAAAPGVAVPVECHVRDAGGRQLTVLLTRSTVPLPDQPLQVCILQDVTQLRRLERQIHSANSAELGRLGSAVHDGIAQDLTGISLLLRTVVGSSPADSGRLAEISAHVRRLIAHARTLARGLSPVQAAGGSLAAALAHCAEDLASRRGIDVRCRTELATLVPGTVQSDQLYRIASEALQWVSATDECSCIDLELRPRGAELLLEIRGDGSGPADGTATGAASGAPLDMVTYLARLLGGRAESHAPAGAGRTFRLLVPLESLAGGEGPPAPTAVSSAHAGGRTSSVPPPN